MTRRWSLSARQVDLANFLAKELDVHPVVGQLLANRGIETADAGRKFLDRKLGSLHDPALLPGIAAGADKLYEAVQANKLICIYGDYDVDGMCATAILVEVLRLAGAKPRFYVPDRLQEGYGVNSDALRRLREDGVDLVVTVDCGVTSVEEAEIARSIGLGFVITDHHELADSIPNADAVIHPRLPGSQYPFPQLCGAGVAFKLAWEFARRMSGGPKTTGPFQKFLLDAVSLAAVGTVCDCVPLVDENRVLVHHGLLSLRQSAPVGLACLIESAGIKDRPRFDSSDIGYVLGPRLNACGRFGQARLGVELLTTRDPERGRELARYLEDANKDRQTLERRILTDAKEQYLVHYGETSPDELGAIVLGSDDWHPGVVGIVAARMVERYHRPCILIAFDGDQGSGSGRSVPGFSLADSMAACKEHVIAAGGHAMAAGLRLKKENFEAFRAAFHAESKRRLIGTELTAEIKIDVEVPLNVLTPHLLNSLDILEPYGIANPHPVMLATDLAVVGEAKKVGGGERHLQFRVGQRGKVIRAIAFDHGPRAEELVSQEGRCCLVFEPSINEFRGYKEIQMRVRDFRPGAAVDGPLAGDVGPTTTPSDAPREISESAGVVAPCPRT